MLDSKVFELTLEQKFDHERVCRVCDDDNIDRAHLAELLKEASRLLMIKDNIIRDLMRRGGL